MNRLNSMTVALLFSMLLTIDPLSAQSGSVAEDYQFLTHQFHELHQAAGDAQHWAHKYLANQIDPQKANDWGDLAWTESEKIRAYLHMFRVTLRDPDLTTRWEYLDEAVQRMDQIFSLRDDERGVASYTDADGTPVILPLWSSVKYTTLKRDGKLYQYDNGNRQLKTACKGAVKTRRYERGDFAYPFIVHTGKILQSVVEFMEMVLDHPRIAAYTCSDGLTCGEKLLAYLPRVKESVAAHEEQWKQGDASGKKRGWYLFRNVNPQLGINCTGEIGGLLPHNQALILGDMLWRLDKVCRAVEPGYTNEYSRRARSMALHFKHNLVANEGDYYLWNYECSPWGVNNDRAEDLGHGFMDVEFAVTAAESYSVFNPNDLRRFAGTLDRSAFAGWEEYQGQQIPAYHARVDGSGELNQHRHVSVKWGLLCPYESHLYFQIFPLVKIWYSNYPGIWRLCDLFQEGYDPYAEPDDTPESHGE